MYYFVSVAKTLTIWCNMVREKKIDNGLVVRTDLITDCTEQTTVITGRLHMVR